MKITTQGDIMTDTINKNDIKTITAICNAEAQRAHTTKIFQTAIAGLKAAVLIPSFTDNEENARQASMLVQGFNGFSYGLTQRGKAGAQILDNSAFLIMSGKGRMPAEPEKFESLLRAKYQEELSDQMTAIGDAMPNHSQDEHWARETRSELNYLFMCAGGDRATSPETQLRFDTLRDSLTDIVGANLYGSGHSTPAATI